MGGEGQWKQRGDAGRGPDATPAPEEETCDSSRRRGGEAGEDRPGARPPSIPGERGRKPGGMICRPFHVCVTCCVHIVHEIKSTWPDARFLYILSPNKKTPNA